MLKKVEIINSAIDGVPEISLRGMIDQYEDGSIVMAIDSCGSSKLRMNINSMGGSVNLGQEVIAAMQMFKNNGGIIETVNRGIAYSTAGWIFSAGSKGHRKMMPFASLMTHPPMFADGKTLSDFQQGSEKWNILADAMNKLIDIFVPITGCSKSKIKNFMMNSTTFSAKQAVKEGFADEVVEISNVVNLRKDLQPEEIMNAVEAIDYDIVNNGGINIDLTKIDFSSGSIIYDDDTINNLRDFLNKQPEPGDTNNNRNMKEVAKLLNLIPEASEDSVLQAIKTLQNRAETSDAAKVAAEKDLATAKAEANSLRNELSTIKEAEVLNYVEKYIGDNKEREGKREKLLNMAKSDFDTFKTICPVDGVGVVNAGAQIDKGIVPAGTKTPDVVELEDAQKFLNMSHVDKIKLKNENLSEYTKLVNAYDKHSAKII